MKDQVDMPTTRNKFARTFLAVLILLAGTWIAPPPSLAWGQLTAPESNLKAPPGLAEGLDVIEIQADTFGLPKSDHSLAGSYTKPSVFLQTGEKVRFNAAIPEDGIYTISMDMSATESFIKGPEGQLTIDGSFPTSDLRRIIFPIYYMNSSDQFPNDRYGNQALISQDRYYHWSKIPVRDVTFSQAYPLQITLAQGVHDFEFTMTQESMLLGSIYIQPFSPYLDYDSYLQENQAADSSGVLVEIEAEFPSFKNDTAVRPVSIRSLQVSPYDVYKQMLNTLGGESWEKSGSTVFYEFSVPQDGMYEISLRWLQNYKNNLTVFRRINIDEKVPFEAFNAVPFEYSTRWGTTPIGEGAPNKVYLTAGKHVLGIEATNSPYYPAILKIQKVLIDINDLSLEIRNLTGNQADPFKEWVISDYIPDIRQRLKAIAEDLQVDMDGLLAINQTGGSQEILMYQMAIENLQYLAEEPDKIPVRMNRLSTGSGSAAQLLGNILTSLQTSPLALDKIYIHSPDTPTPPVQISLATQVIDGIKRFISSFKPDPYTSIGAQANEIEVWVNRPRQYVDLMQYITDQGFTKETGIPVKLSIMPNESKLVLANAAGIAPDVALGVSTNIPYELAIRNALKDLRTFDDFNAFINIFSPGALLSYIINDSVYAIPEAQDFWVTFYRKDILDSLNIPVPKTYPEVIEILPELQRYGMNYSTPLSGGAGLKGYLVTAPYLFNYGAELYSPDGFSTGLDSEEAVMAVRFMTESFTVYGMPFTTSSFYDSFRYGTMPVGVSNFTDYIKLLTAAPELIGLWDIDLYPATVLPDGTENRWATGSAQACIMFADTDRPDEAWEFLKWWMSTETQVDFQDQLVLNYGLDYLWNSANVEAFSYIPIPQKHKDVILEQWEWLQEPVRLPGSYMQERELSNAWNKIVFDGVNPRIAIDDAIRIINREIARKMEEFGYLENGVQVKDFKVPTIDTVREWQEAK
jgi:ABC-type glycerol-3-phosphate transport system substrate-binding protein